MKKILFLLVFLSNSALADWDDPTKPFDTKSNYTRTVKLNWIPVDNVQKVCELEYKKRKLTLTHRVDACSFWANYTCTIYTKKTPNMHDVGHEVRHCFQGNWH
jgi:hypothetical protein